MKAERHPEVHATDPGRRNGAAVDLDGIFRQARTDVNAITVAAVPADPAGPGDEDIDRPHAVSTVANYKLVETEIVDNKAEARLKATREPERIDQIAANLLVLSSGWPKASGGLLFVEGRDGRPEYLTKTAELFGWIHGLASVDWIKGSRYATKEEFLSRLTAKVERYDAIETLPHEPQLPGTYYMHAPLPAGNGRALEAYLDYFCPATKLDRVLMRAAVMTLFWGGRPGNRPAFLVKGQDHDPKRGRGIGKTHFVDIAAQELCGGYVDVTQKDTIPELKSRLLSPQGLQQRVCRLDNVKTLRLSWAELEGLITAGTISGKWYYHGEGHRPNTLTWFITSNGLFLAKDIALRVIPLELARPPKYDATWEHSVRAFAAEHRYEIIADILARLSEPGETLKSSSRWSDWEKHVLARAVNDAADLNACQKLIASRQKAIDDDDHERELVLAHIRGALTARVGTPDDKKVFIPAGVVAQWLKTATGEDRPNTRAMTYVNGLGISELRKTVNSGYPGFEWKGQSCRKNAELLKPFANAVRQSMS
jgi:hypothetical protein